MYQYISEQNKRIQNLESIIQELQQEVTSLKDKPSINVENIEYRFDQLKVETLEGTLNIGLNPGELEKIEDLAVEAQPSPAPVPPVKQFDMEDVQMSMMPRINGYIEKEVPVIIHDTENQLGITLDESYHHLIKEDIKKQIPQRLQFYIQSIPGSERQQGEASWEETIFSRIKTDINKAIYSFMANLPDNLKGKGDANHGPSSDQS
ncbi:spore germination protein GerPC [Bacillus salacetis]|nr:spore germination protein GerPC [Bacillus salacetis]